MEHRECESIKTILLCTLLAGLICIGMAACGMHITDRDTGIDYDAWERVNDDN